MYVEIINKQQAVEINKEQMAAAVALVIAAEKQYCDEVAVHFVSQTAIVELHGRFFDDFTPTDCISLPIDAADEGGYRHLGEVFVCPEVALEYVREHGGDVHEETVLYVVHGLLHLMGYDDLVASEQASMRAAEEGHLSRIKQAGILFLC